MILRQGMELTVAGVVLGMIGAAALTRVMARLLFGVSAHDLMTFLTVPLVLGWDRAARDLHPGTARDSGRSGGRAQGGIDQSNPKFQAPNPNHVQIPTTPNSKLPLGSWSLELGI